MRKLVIIAVGICVVLVIVLALLPQFLDVNHYRPRIQAELQNRLGRPVTLGNIKASFLPPSLIVKDVTIGEDVRFGNGAFAKAQELDVRVALIPLLQKDLQVQSLRLMSPNPDDQESGRRVELRVIGTIPSSRCISAFEAAGTAEAEGQLLKPEGKRYRATIGA